MYFNMMRFFSVRIYRGLYMFSHHFPHSKLLEFSTELESQILRHTERNKVVIDQRLI